MSKYIHIPSFVAAVAIAAMVSWLLALAWNAAFFTVLAVVLATFVANALVIAMEDRSEERREQGDHVLPKSASVHPVDSRVDE